MWNAEDVECQGCRMRMMQNADDTECGGYRVRRMQNAEDAECGGCGMPRMQNAEDVECGGCGMRRMWTVKNGEWGGCGMRRMQNAEDTECGGRGMKASREFELLTLSQSLLMATGRFARKNISGLLSNRNSNFSGFQDHSDFRVSHPDSPSSGRIFQLRMKTHVYKESTTIDEEIEK
jgi:DNA-directed RNA polymerase subunit RPC12/RpoP